MGSRREGRELALQALYQIDMSGDEDPTRGLALFWSHFDGGDEAQVFARELVAGVRGSQERIDALIRDTAQHWRLPRLSRVDLNLLRLAAFELMGRPDIPASVTINEAVEIGRRFGGEDSAAFVNGVLDAIATALGAKEREKPSGTE